MKKFTTRRLMVCLPEGLAGALAAESGRSGVPEAEVVRRALSARLALGEGAEAAGIREGAAEVFEAALGPAEIRGRRTRGRGVARTGDGNRGKAAVGKVERRPAEVGQEMPAPAALRRPVGKYRRMTVVEAAKEAGSKTVEAINWLVGQGVEANGQTEVGPEVVERMVEAFKR